jgi:hypothetical protein
MSRTPLGAGDAVYCSSRDKGDGAAVGGAAPLMVRAACGENLSMVQLAPVGAAAGAANATAEARGFWRRLQPMVRPTICHTAMLSRMQQELDFHGFVWKNDAPVVCAIKDTGIQ